MGLAFVFCASLTGVTERQARDLRTSEPRSTMKGTVMTASGTFDVRVIPQPADDGGGPFSRVFLEKDLRGDLAGSSRGHMLGAETAVQGSGGYVALELVTGTLNGRAGSFVLQHSGHMAHGAMSMTATVVPDSGTDELRGLAGTFIITISDGKHCYAFEYTLRD